MPGPLVRAKKRGLGLYFPAICRHRFPGVPSVFCKRENVFLGNAAALRDFLYARACLLVRGSEPLFLPGQRKKNSL